MDYYQKRIYIPQVDQEDRIIGRVERWEAHKKAILHRGFTTVLLYKEKLILQHRKHPVFDGVWDMSFSSHQTYKDDYLLSPTEAILATLEREWHLKNDSHFIPQFLGKYYYQKKDPHSEFWEHEINHVYKLVIEKLPMFNTTYAYGMNVLDKEEVKNNHQHLSYAPWVSGILELL